MGFLWSAGIIDLCKYYWWISILWRRFISTEASSCSTNLHTILHPYRLCSVGCTVDALLSSTFTCCYRCTTILFLLFIVVLEREACDPLNLVEVSVWSTGLGGSISIFPVSCWWFFCSYILVSCPVGIDITTENILYRSQPRYGTGWVLR